MWKKSFISLRESSITISVQVKYSPCVQQIIFSENSMDFQNINGRFNHQESRCSSACIWVGGHRRFYLLSQNSVFCDLVSEMTCTTQNWNDRSNKNSSFMFRLCGKLTIFYYMSVTIYLNIAQLIRTGSALLPSFQNLFQLIQLCGVKSLRLIYVFMYGKLN